MDTSNKVEKFKQVIKKHKVSYDDLAPLLVSQNTGKPVKGRGGVSWLLANKFEQYEAALVAALNAALSRAHIAISYTADDIYSEPAQ